MTVPREGERPFYKVHWWQRGVIRARRDGARDRRTNKLPSLSLSLYFCPLLLSLPLCVFIYTSVWTGFWGTLRRSSRRGAEFQSAASYLTRVHRGLRWRSESSERNSIHGLCANNHKLRPWKLKPEQINKRRRGGLRLWQRGGALNGLRQGEEGQAEGNGRGRYSNNLRKHYVWEDERADWQEECEAWEKNRLVCVQLRPSLPLKRPSWNNYPLLRDALYSSCLFSVVPHSSSSSTTIKPS